VFSGGGIRDRRDGAGGWRVDPGEFVKTLAQGMMAYEKTIQRVKQELDTTFDTLDAFFDLPGEMRAYQLSDNARSINDITRCRQTDHVRSAPRMPGLSRPDQAR
jgi:hypothetical protein